MQPSRRIVFAAFDASYRLRTGAVKALSRLRVHRVGHARGMT
jgi:hypothetical protein